MPLSFSLSRLLMRLRSGIVPSRLLPHSQSSLKSVIVFSHAGTPPDRPVPCTLLILSPSASRFHLTLLVR